MSEMEFENKLHSIANGMEYPRTPDVSGSVTARLRASTRPRFISKAFAWSLTIIVVLFSSLLFIPSARAAIIEFIQIGIVRIFPRPPVEPTVEQIRTAAPESVTPVTATPSSQVSTLIPILDKIAGETSLANARKIVPYSIRIPTYPSDLDDPDRVYVQDVDNGQMTVLVWLDPQQPDKVSMSLHFIPSDSWAINKMGPKIIQQTHVDGRRAIWAEGPYPLILQNDNMEFTRLIDGHVLIWTVGDLTYRLETNLSLEEAIKIAEALEPIR